MGNGSIKQVRPSSWGYICPRGKNCRESIFCKVIKMLTLNFERRFQLYVYTASHRQALFRSLDYSSGEKRIEILFSNIEYFDAPTAMNQFLMQEIDRDEAMTFMGSRMCHVCLDARFFQVFGPNWSGVIAAGNVAWDERSVDSHHEDSALLVGPYAGGVYTVSALNWLRGIFYRALFSLRKVK